MSELDKEYEASLKSIETENVIDRIFYRPIGFRIARMLRGTGITPNMVTVVSIFVGAAVGLLFYQDDLYYNICGILLLICANILDCVDGQLARLTGIKSAIGRILDGFAGDIWFASIYVGFAARLSNEYGTNLFFILAVLSGMSHLVQANITDYYKTLHLYFISKDKGAEFQSLEQVEARHKASLRERYGDDIPEDIRLDFRKRSRALMRYIDLLTFNGRTIVMFVIVLTGQVWAYFLYEILVLNIVLVFVSRRHERMCSAFVDR